MCQDAPRAICGRFFIGELQLLLDLSNPLG